MLGGERERMQMLLEALGTTLGLLETCLSFTSLFPLSATPVSSCCLIWKVSVSSRKAGAKGKDPLQLWRPLPGININSQQIHCICFYKPVFVELERGVGWEWQFQIEELAFSSALGNILKIVLNIPFHQGYCLRSWESNTSINIELKLLGI